MASLPPEPFGMGDRGPRRSAQTACRDEIASDHLVSLPALGAAHPLASRMHAARSPEQRRPRVLIHRRMTDRLAERNAHPRWSSGRRSVADAGTAGAQRRAIPPRRSPC